MSDSIRPYILAFIAGIVMIAIGTTFQSLGIGAVGGLMLGATASILIYNSIR